MDKWTVKYLHTNVLQVEYGPISFYVNIDTKTYYVSKAHSIYIKNSDWRELVILIRDAYRECQ